MTFGGVDPELEPIDEGYEENPDEASEGTLDSSADESSEDASVEDEKVDDTKEKDPKEE